MLNLRGAALISVALVAAIAPAALLGAEPGWLTGAALERRLQEPLSRSIDGLPLREALYALGHEQGVGVLLDRRIDPTRKLDITVRQAALSQLLQQIAKEQRIGMSRLDAVCYFGPPTVAARLRTLAELRREEIRGRSATLAAKFSRQRAMRWPDLATPAGVLKELVAENQLQLAGVEQVPHDLWAGAELPPLSLTDRLTLLLVQFDLTFRVAGSGETVRLIPIPADVQLTRSYAGGRDPQALANKWAPLLPNTRIAVSGDRIVVQGLIEEHEQIARGFRPAGTRQDAALPAAKDQLRHTVKRAEGPLEALLAQLARRFDLDVRYDEAALKRAGISLQQPVRFSVSEATEDELFAALLKEAGCQFRREGRVLYIEPAASKGRDR